MELPGIVIFQVPEDSKVGGKDIIVEISLKRKGLLRVGLKVKNSSIYLYHRVSMTKHTRNM